MADYNQRIKVSTNSLSFFNEERQMLKLSFLEDSVVVSICNPEFANEKLSYPQQMRHSVLVNQNNASALYDIITRIIIPAYEAGNSKDAGIFTNRAKTQMLEVMVEGGSFFVVIHDEIENRIPKNSYTFKFDKTTIITDYDIKAVSFKTEEVDASFTVFAKAFEAFQNLSNGITAHEYQYRQSYYIEQIRKLITALDTKFNLGIAYKNGNYNKPNSGFNEGYSPAEVRESTMDSIMGALTDEIPFK